ncbi:hypothetical protein ACI65C_009067 [Semiaphis heraclei]
MADQHFDTNLFEMTIKDFILKNPITINDLINVQLKMRDIRLDLNLEELGVSNIEEIDPYGPSDPVLQDSYVPLLETTRVS